MTSPLVSIIIPTYNRAHLIGETLDSVLSQTYTHWECIVVDDGSSDNTAEVVGAFVEKDIRFQYHHRPKDRLPGGNAARNYGFELSKGEYINWLDSDDLLSKNKLSEQLKKIINIPFSVSTCKWSRFSTPKRIEFKAKDHIFYRNYYSPQSILNDFGKSKSFMPSHAFLVSRDILGKSGLWNETLKVNQDGEFFVRVIIESSIILFAEYATVYYRISEQSSTSSLDNLAKLNESIKSWILIENFLMKKEKASFEVFLNQRKEYLYLKVKIIDKNIIKEHRKFFKNQIRKFSILNRIKRKLF
ncbi:glycosyltransferase family 2 protein [Gaetbulibacter sp. PBL-D1]|uniref:glycosyltransferase family 2 protein n=1 Tax=Gaetbulibacter sp. PBL-D1 TaxID=3422594 RepID=UPI003D2F3FFE